MLTRLLIVLIVASIAFQGPAAQADFPVTVTSNVPYGPDPQQKLDVYSPGPGVGRPGVIMIHGGGWVRGNRGTIAPYVSDFVRRTGFVAFSMGYRTGSSQRWIDQPADVLAALAFVRSNAGTYGIDPARMGLFGFSAGAHLAMLTAFKGQGPLTAPGRVKVVGEMDGPTDLPSIVIQQGCALSPCNPVQRPLPPVTIEDKTFDDVSDYTNVVQFAGGFIQAFEGYCTMLGCYDPANPIKLVPVGGCGAGIAPCANRYITTSPINFVDSTDPPTFVIHPIGDTIVPFEQAMELKAAMMAKGVEHKMNTPPLVSHGVKVDSEYWANAVDFLRQHL